MGLFQQPARRTASMTGVRSNNCVRPLRGTDAFVIVPEGSCDGRIDVEAATVGLMAILRSRERGLYALGVIAASLALPRGPPQVSP